MGEEQSMNCMRNHFSECNKDRKSLRDVLVVVAFFSLCFFHFCRPFTMHFCSIRNVFFCCA